MRATAQIEIEIAARIGSKAGFGARTLRRLPFSPAASLRRRGEYVLDVLEVAMNGCRSPSMVSLRALNRAKNVIGAGRRNLLPEHLPFVARRAQREAVVRRHERAGRDRDDASLQDFTSSPGRRSEHEGGAEIAPAPHQIGVGVHQVGIRSSMLSSYASFTSASTATTPFATPISGLTSASRDGRAVGDREPRQRDQRLRPARRDRRAAGRDSRRAPSAPRPRRSWPWPR